MGASATLTAIFAAQDRMSQTIAGIDRQGNVLNNTFKKVAAAATAAFSVAKLTEFGKAAAQAAISFESGMSEVYTLLPDISSEAMSKMEDDVKRFAKETGTLTTETVPALYQALSAGVSQDTVFDFLDTANKAAIGGVSTLEVAVDGLSSVVNAYGADALDASMASDYMFTTVKLGKTTFDELANSLYNVVPTAVGAGLGFDNVSAALAAMTAQGIPTSVATTQLRQAIVELADSGTEVGKTFDKLTGQSFKAFLADGGNLQDALQVLESHAGDLNVGINELFGSVEAGNAVLALTGNGTQKFTEALDAMAAAAGATDAAFATMEESMERKIAKIESTWEVAKVEVGGAIIDALLPAFEWLEDNMDEVVDLVKDGFGLLGEGISTVWDYAEPLLKWIKANPTLVSGALKTLGAVIIGNKVVSGVSGVVQSVSQLGSALKLFGAGPLGIAAAAAGAIVGIGVAVHEVHENMKAANLAEHFGEISLSMEEMRTIAEDIIYGDTFGQLQEAITHFDAVESLQNSLNDATNTINKLNWKVGIGLELTESDQATYKQAIESFIADSQQLIEEQHYALTLAFDFFLGDSSIGEGTLRGLNSSFGEAQSELAELGKELQSVVNEAFADGLLTFNESEIIRDLQADMSEITSAIAQSEYLGKLAAIEGKYSGADLTAETYQQMLDELQGAADEYTQTLEDNYFLAMGELMRQRDAGDISTALYDQRSEALSESFNQMVAAANSKVASFGMTTISDTYNAEISAAFDAVSDSIPALIEQKQSEWIAAITEGTPGTLDEIVTTMTHEAASTLDSTTKGALEDLYEMLEPSKEDMLALAKSYTDAGKAIPESLAYGIMNASTIGALLGNREDAFRMAGLLLEESAPEVLDQMFTMGTSIPEQLVEGIEAQQSLVEAAGADILSWLGDVLKNGWQFDIPITANLGGSDVTGDLFSRTSLIDSRTLATYAGGTTYAEDVFIAGERGPELIVGMGGSTVFPADETARILDAINSERSLDVPAPSFSREERSGERVITLRIEGVGEIRIPQGTSKEEIAGMLQELIRPALVSVLIEEEFEEGDRSYDF